jgi:transposase
MTKLRERDLVVMDVLREKGRSTRATARELGVDESTLRYRIRRREAEIGDGRCRQPEACADWEGVIGPWLVAQQDGEGARPESVRLLYEDLVERHGYEGSYKAVLRYVRRRMAPSRLRPIRRVETRPGAQAQVDWFEEVPVRVEELGGRITLDALVVTLSHSRMFAVIWALSRNLLWWLTGHNQAFERLGGIPWTVRIDNLKTGVAWGAGPWARVQDGYASYARQLGFVVDPCRVRQASDKGKVERRGRDARGFLDVFKDICFLRLDDLQMATDERVTIRVQRLICPVTGRSIFESWRAEQDSLLTLPETLPEPFDVQVNRPVSDDCLVGFEGHQYEVPFLFIRRTVQVRGCAGTVEIYSADGQHLASYPRGTECRLLLDQRHAEGSGDDRVMAPTPLGKVGRAIVLEKSWEVTRRPIDDYLELVRRLA